MKTKHITEAVISVADSDESLDGIKKAFKDKGIELYGSSETNQQFPLLTDEQIAKLSENFVFEVWGKEKDRTIVRFCTSWATSDENVEALIATIEKL